MAEKKSPFVVMEENLPMHDFTENDVLVCQISKSVTLGEDSEEPFDVWKGVNLETGEEIHIPSAYTISKCVNKVKGDLVQIVFNIKFLGKSEHKEKQLNLFTISSCSLQQYQEYTKPKTSK